MSTRYSVRMRLAFGYMCWSIFLAVLTGFLSYYVLITRLEQQLDRELKTGAETLSEKFRTADQRVEQISAETAQYSYQLINDSGTVVRTSADLAATVLPTTPHSQESLESRRPALETLDLGSARMRVLDVPFTDVSNKRYLLRVIAPLAFIEGVRSEFSSVLMWVVPLIAFAGAVSAWLVLRQALLPVRQIGLAAQRITASNLPDSLPLHGSGDELDQVSSAFNSIINEMHVASQRMWQYLSNISHEMRTPLAALRAETEVALRWAHTEEEYRQVLASNIEELDRITKTVSEMLELARAEAGQVEVTHKRENVTELARAAVGAMEALAAQRRVTLHMEDSPEVIAEIASEHVLRLLLILLDNAIKYSYAPGDVRVAVRERSGWALIMVTDKGRGIASEDLPHIFERFYRSQGGRTREIEGAGLGLSHADWIVKAHQGKIEVDSKIGHGTRFIVWLPLIARRAETASA